MLDHRTMRDRPKCWRHSVLGLLAMALSFTLYAQSPERGNETQVVRFSESSAIRSLDGGQTWELTEGQLDEVPYWAQPWLNPNHQPTPSQIQTTPADRWKPRTATLELEEGGLLRLDAQRNVWKLEAGDEKDVPYWARTWGGEVPSLRPEELSSIPVESLCQGEHPQQRTQTVQIGSDLAIRSYDGGNTWVMAEGDRADLPDWAEAWLDQPVVEVQPAKELSFGPALIRSVDGGKTWTQVQGQLTDLPEWVRPWVGGAYPSVQQPLQAREAESALAQGLELFPNPAQQSAILRFEQERTQEVRIALYDLQGRRLREIHQGVLQEGKQSLDFSVAELAAGAYFLEFNTSDQHHRIRLLKVE